jgi:hypothetical protein
MLNKHDIDNAKRWIKNKWWRLQYKDEMIAFIVVGTILILTAGFTAWLIKG